MMKIMIENLEDVRELDGIMKVEARWSSHIISRPAMFNLVMDVKSERS